MPIFEYRCKDCGTVSEILQGVTREDVTVKCSSCGSANLTKLISSHSVLGKKEHDREGSCCGGEKKDFSDCVPGSCCGRYTIGEQMK